MPYNHIVRLLLLISTLSYAMMAHAMEYGLRFSSYDVPINERTTLFLGEYSYTDRLAVEFDMSFYDRDMYGQICMIGLGNGSTVNLLSSAQGRKFYPTLVVNDSIHTIPADFNLDRTQSYRMRLTLDKAKSLIELSVDDTHYSFPAYLGKENTASVTFGGEPQSYNSAPPVDVRDIRVYADGRNTAWWELREHEGDSISDKISGMRGTANNPTWLHDAHSRWTLLYSCTTSKTVQSAYNPATDDFYIVTPDTITIWNATTADTTAIAVGNDGRMMKLSNYLIYNPVDNTLLSYDLSDGATSSFDFSTRTWSYGANDRNFSAAHGNHSVLINDNKAYVFGGYGFHSYHNDLFEIDFTTDSIRSVNLNPAPAPRTSASSGSAGGKLYIFGGIGNESGRQELPLETYYDLWEYNLDTFSGKRLWSVDKPYKEDFICSSQMYYVERDSAFYFAATLTGGTLIRMSPTTRKFERMSEPLCTNMHYRDCVFELYRSDTGGNFYLVIDKRYNNLSHELAIYCITYPFVPYAGSIGAVKPEKTENPQKHTLFPIIIGAIAVVIVAGGIIIVGLKQRRCGIRPTVDNEEGSSSSKIPTCDLPESNGDQPTTTDDTGKSGGQIRLLGNFLVIDANGNDITSQFTPRVRDLLAILILWSDKDSKGIPQQKLDEEIWRDKGEKSAKTNRNVYIHKLRTLLESVGNVQITYDKGYYRLIPGNVGVDYLTVSEAVMGAEKSNAETTVAERAIVRKLGAGSLLSGCNSPWADPFKAEFSNRAQTLLIRLLQQEQMKASPDEEYLYQIADTLSIHDPLSEEALAVKCRILYIRKKNSLSKTIYDAFSKEYLASFGTPYPHTFQQLISGK